MSTSSESETQQLLDRISAVDPLIASVCDLDPTALDQARRLDAERADGRVRSRLHGRPVLVKDNIDTAGLATTAGSLALAGSPPARDAALVTRLREAGMVLLGKTNLSEWANIRDEHSSSGWSAHGGLTRNPYALNRSAYGSSSGSGAAVGARLAPYAIGTETNGSITTPAAACGTVGLKPTVGLVPTEGVVPISSTQDAPGPMALTVADTAALLDVLAGTSYAEGLEPRVRGRRIGVPRDVWGFSSVADEVAERALRLLAAAGAEVVEVSLPTLKDFDWSAGLLLMLAELKHELARYLAERGAEVRSLADVIAFNRAHADEELPWFGQGLFEQAEQTEGLGARDYLDAADACAAAGIVELDRVLGSEDLDALFAPAAPPATPIDLVNGDAISGASSSSSALAGAPILTIPAELVHGLPVAVSLWGARGSEGTLLELGAAYEAARDAGTGTLPEPTFPDWV